MKSIKKLGIELSIPKILKASHRIILAGLVFWGLMNAAAASAAAAEVVDRIVAIVNEDIVTLSELNEVYQPYEKKVLAYGYPPDKEREMLFKLRSDILDQLIDKKLTEQEIKRLGIRVTEKEIDTAIERIKEKNFLTDEDLREKLASDDMTMESFRKNIKEQILRTELLDREVRSNIIVTQEDIKAYYDDHPEAFSAEKTYHLRHIILKKSPSDDKAENADILNRIQTLYKRLQEGEPFELLATNHSESPLAEKGGDLGSFSLKDLAPHIREAVGKLKAGEFTPVLDTDQGYQIFYVESIQESPAKPLASVSGEIQDKLYNQMAEEKFKTWVTALRQGAQIEKKL